MKTILLLFCFMICVPSVWAQDRVPKAVYVFEGKDIAGFQWLPNDLGLMISDEIIRHESWTEVEYSLTTQQWRASRDIQFTDNLKLLNMSAGGNKSVQTLSSVTYISPNTRWAVYPIVENDQAYLVLQDMKFDQSRIMHDLPILLPYSGRFEVNWSSESLAFYVYSTDGPVTYWYYVHGFEHKLEEARVVILHDRRGPFQSAVIGFREIFDIDTTGNFLLIEKDIRVDNRAQVELIIVNLSDYSFVSLFVIHNIKAASFGNGNEIFYISSEGMYVYDREAGTSYLLNPDINSSWIQHVEISPDGRYIAATEGGDTNSLYIIPVTPQ